MSQALRTVLMRRLTDGISGNDGAIALGLGKLVARDPNDGASPAIFNGFKNQSPQVYDCVTYRLTGDTPDARFRGAVGSPLSGRIYNPVLEIEFWSRSADSQPVDRVAGRLLALFDNVAFAVPAVPLPAVAEGEPDEIDNGGRVISCVCSTDQRDHFDKTNNCWFGLFRFHLRYSLR